MKPLTELLICMGVLAALAFLSGAWLWFLVRRPGQWTAFVEKENAFWVRKGILSRAFVEKWKWIDTAVWVKLLVGAAFVINASAFVYGVFLIIRSGALTHR